jgi:hypothetical protein
MDVIEIACAKCGSPMRLHLPLVAMAHDSRLSQVSLVPSWSIDERKCRECGTINAPMVTKIQTEWIGYDDPNDQKLIQPATISDLARLQ